MAGAAMYPGTSSDRHAVGGGDLVHGPLQVAADGRGRVEQHHAV